MNPSPTNQIIKYVGLDVHAKTIAAAIAHAGGDVVSYGTIPAHSTTELSHAGPVTWTANAELKRPTGVGCSDFVRQFHRNNQSTAS